MTPTPNTPPRSSSPGAATSPSGEILPAGGFPDHGEPKMTALNFRAETATPTLADMAAVYPPLPEGWTPADDVALWEGLFRGLKLMEIGAPLGKTLDQMTARFIAFRHAATGGVGPLTLVAQTRWLELARGRAT